MLVLQLLLLAVQIKRQQQVRLILDICDRAYVLQRGRVQLSGTAAELRRERPDVGRGRS